MKNTVFERIMLRSSYPTTLAVLLEASEWDSLYKNIQKGIDRTIKSMQNRTANFSQVVGTFPGGDFKDILEGAIKNVTEAVDQSIENVKEIKYDETDESMESINKITTQQDAVLDVLKLQGEAFASLVKGNNAIMQVLAQAVLKGNLHKGDLKDDPMGVILEEIEAKGDAIKSIEAAVEKAYTKPSKPEGGGFMKNLKSYFSETEEVIGQVDDALNKNLGVLIEAVLDLTPMDIGNIAMSIVNAGKQDTSAAQKMDADIKDVEDDLDDTPGTETEEAPAGIKKSDLLAKAKEAAGDAGTLVIQRLIDRGVFEKLGLKLTESLMTRSLMGLLTEEAVIIPFGELQAAVEDAADDLPDDFDMDELIDALNSLDDPDIEIEKQEIDPRDLEGKDFRKARWKVTLDGEELVKGRATDVSDTIAYELTKDEDMQMDFADDAEIEVDGGNMKVPFMEVEPFVDRVNKSLEDEGKTEFRLGKEAEEEKEEEEPTGPKVMKKTDWDRKVGRDAEIPIGKASASLLAKTLTDLGRVKFESVNTLISMLNEGIIDDVVAAIESDSEADDKLKQSLIKKLKGNKNGIAAYIEEEFGEEEKTPFSPEEKAAAKEEAKEEKKEKSEGFSRIRRLAGII